MRLTKIKKSIKIFLYLFGFFGLICSFATGSLAAKPPSNFGEAKQAAKRIFSDHRKTFYCGCKYDKHGKINLRSCGYRIQKDKRRARRLEWEHIVPVSLWGQHFDCWREPICCKGKSCYRGRACCRKIDKKFSKLEADLHNIVPAIGEVNALRSNYRFGLLPHIPLGQFGVCEVKIDDETRRVEPPSTVRGIIARAYLYMADEYDIPLSHAQRKLFSAWNIQHPPEDQERSWDNQVAYIQGNHNTYILNYKDRK